MEVDVLEEVGDVSSRMERDFMRSATAIVAGLVGVLGYTERLSGLVEVR